MENRSWWGRVRALIVGRPRDLGDRALFHKISLVAVLAWVGLGADGLSSSCYGPEETYKALGRYPSLTILIAGICCATIAVICLSYRQIIDLFPGGGGGYLVASKLLGPTAGVVSGSALIVDYVLTITISIASGADALFSVLPESYATWKVSFAAVGIAVMTLLNLRGVRESVVIWAPIFFLFLATHAAGILIAIGSHVGDFGTVAARTGQDLRSAHHDLGTLGIVVLLLRAFSVGAGTYTGIEAVSNGLPVLREPRAETGKKTMIYMGLSLGGMVLGLLLAYMLVNVQPVEGKTLNAVLFETVTSKWPPALATTFVTTAMLSATALLFIAAQAGFLDGPRVLANMALDRWFPSRFASISDRFVTQNGIVLMSVAAIAALLFTGGSVGTLVVLYSINVFLTFTLSQLGMCRHWLNERRAGRTWKRGLAVSTTGMLVTGSILISLTVIKFFEGGWVTIAVTAAVVGLAFLIRRHYQHSAKSLEKLNGVLKDVESGPVFGTPEMPVAGQGRTAIILVNGYNGLGVHTMLNLLKTFPRTFDRLLFILVGAVDAGTFKGKDELDRLRERTTTEGEQYVRLAKTIGLRAEARTAIGHDVLTEIQTLTDDAFRTEKNAIIFAGQLAFQTETFWTRLLHNHFVFSLQRYFCRTAKPFVIVPLRI